MPRKAHEQFRVGCAFRSIPGEYDQIDGRQLGTTATKALAHETLQTVSVDRMAYFLARYGEAKTRYGQGIGPVKYREKPVG